MFAAGVFVAGMAAAFLLGNLPRRRAGAARRWRSCSASAAIIVYNDPDHVAGELIFVAGAVRRSAGSPASRCASAPQQAEAAEERAAQAEREREAAARLAVAEERARIARELHDIVAHAVSVMVLQVGAVRHKLPDALDEDREALHGVEQTGRTALAEMRRLLGAMRDDGDDAELAPQPGLDSLDALLEEVRRAGLPVELQVEGEPSPLPRAIDLSAYRIVQEGLTNALKHAHASQADVSSATAPDELQHRGARRRRRRRRRATASATASSASRERVKIYGGEMTAGAATGGGFVLSTRLPLERTRP